VHNCIISRYTCLTPPGPRNPVCPCLARRRDHGNPVFHAAHAPGTAESLFPMPRPCLAPPGPRNPVCPRLAGRRDHGNPVFHAAHLPGNPVSHCIARPGTTESLSQASTMPHTPGTTEPCCPWMPRTPPGPRNPCFPSPPGPRIPVVGASRRRDHGTPVFHASHVVGTTETLFHASHAPGPRHPRFPIAPGTTDPCCRCLARPRKPCFPCFARRRDHGIWNPRFHVSHAPGTSETRFYILCLARLARPRDHEIPVSSDARETQILPEVQGGLSRLLQY
jgi:hypothetical protein